ncbi:MAG: hypothetical protein QOF16_486 [Actinomycetota bacterium]|jgi:hypothetical protein|nr:hypothetical protein [Actinomycetota bacterium]
MQEQLHRLEDELRRVPGVRSARIVGADAPSEIHIVATRERSPKQVVRDVQSLASAGFGIAIDHRIVSVVQLEDDEPTISLESGAGPPPPPQPSFVEAHVGAAINNGHRGRRPLVESVIAANKHDGPWVRVTLSWPNGDTTEGAVVAGATREIRARAAAFAAARALEEPLHAAGASIDIEQVIIHRLGSSDAVLVRASFTERYGTTPVVGSALIYDDAATAAVHALLHAVNRKLS